MPLRLEDSARRVWTVTYLAVKRFLRIDGSHWADSLAFNAFFSLFPLIILFVTLCLLYTSDAADE